MAYSECIYIERERCRVWYFGHFWLWSCFKEVKWNVCHIVLIVWKVFLQEGIASKTVNHPKVSESTKNYSIESAQYHLKPSATTQSHPLRSIHNPPEPSAIAQNHPQQVNLIRTSCNWSETIHIYLRTLICYQNYPETLKKGLVKTC